MNINNKKNIFFLKQKQFITLSSEGERFFKNKTTPITMPNTHKTAAAMAIYMPIDDDDDAEVLSSGVK